MQYLCIIKHCSSRRKWFEIIKASCYNLMLEILAYALGAYNIKSWNLVFPIPSDKFLGASCIKEMVDCLSFLCFSLTAEDKTSERGNMELDFLRDIMDWILSSWNYIPQQTLIFSYLKLLKKEKQNHPHHTGFSLVIFHLYL